MSDVTIQKVAKAARVSAASVSNFLNGRHERMRQETRDRISQVIQTLDYRPNGVARQLKTGRVSMLGILVPTVTNPFYGELAVAVEQAAQQRGYRVLLCNTLRDPLRERAFADELSSYGVRGLIAAGTLSDPEEIRALARRRTVVVALDLRRDDIGLDSVDIVSMDNAAAGELAVDHLVALGHRRIAYVNAPGQASSRRRRQQGFSAAIQRHGLGAPVVVMGEAASPETTYADTELVELGRTVVRQLLALNPRPTAVVALNDMIAAGVQGGLQDCGLVVPDDISVVGVDDISLTRLLSPALTTIRQPTDRMAEAAVARLADRLEGCAETGVEIVFAPELVIRASSGRVPADPVRQPCYR